MSKNLFNFFSSFWIIDSYESHIVSRCYMRTIRTDRNYSNLLICTCWILFCYFFSFALRLLSYVFKMIKLIWGVNHFFKFFTIDVSFDFLFEVWILKIVIMPDSNRLIAWTCGKSENIFVWTRHNFEIVDRTIVSKESSADLDLLSILHIPNQSHFVRVKNN